MKERNFNGAFQIILNILGTIKSSPPFSPQQGSEVNT